MSTLEDDELSHLITTTTAEEEVSQANPQPQSKATYRQLFSYATPFDYFLMIVGSLSGIINGATLPLVMLVFGATINNFTTANVTEFNPNETHHYKEDFMHTAWVKCYTFLAIGGIAFLMGLLQYLCWMWTGERQSRRIREEYLKSILRQDVGWFDKIQSGELTTRVVSETLQVQDAMGEKCGQVFQYFAAFFTGISLAFLHDGWRLALVMMSVMPILIICAAVVGFLFTNMTKRAQDSYAKAGTVAEEVFASIRTVVAFSLEGTVSDSYTSHVQEALRSSVTKGMVAGIGFGVTFFVIFGAYGLAFWYGGKLVSEYVMEAGNVMQVFFCLMVGAFSIGQSSPALNSIGEGRAVAHKIFDVINRNPPIDSFDESGYRPSVCEGEVEFRDVTFSYPTREEVAVVRNLSFSVKKGQTFALVGSSGCGKSTVMALLERFYDPQDGQVLLDGNPLTSLNLRWLRSQIGIVRQEPVLFNRSIAENIALGREGHCTEQEIHQAARDANAHEFITSLPDGYNTNCGQQGAQLSGGQKQRIAIARALIRNPKVLLLDEATSALDTQSEKIIQEALDQVRRGRTAIIIAHRLSTIRDADVIGVVALGEDGGGRIVEQGNHEELMSLKGAYYSMVLAQEMGHTQGQIEEPVLSFKKSTSQPHSSTRLKDARRALQKSSDGDVYVALEDEEKREEEVVGPVSLSRLVSLNSPELFYNLVGLLAATVNGIVNPAFAIIFSHVTNVFAEVPPENSNEGFGHYKYELRIWSFMFLGLGILCGVINFLQITMFTIAGERLTTRLRDMCFRSIVSQDISFFDLRENSVGALTTRLSKDATLVHGMLGIRLGTLIQCTVNLVAGLGIALYYSWKMSLVVLACVPFIAVAGAIQMQRMKDYSEQARAQYQKAGEVASEAIENVRTVNVLNKEDAFLSSFSNKLDEPYRAGIRSALIAGFGFGLSQLFLYAAYGVSFYYGAYLFANNQISFLNMMIVFSAVVFSAMAVGQITSLSPDQAKARAAAYHILRLIDTHPSLDSLTDQVGIRPLANTVEGAIELKEISFKYPSREIQIFDNLNLSVNPNTTIALVGESGCGKSTVIGLLERFYDPVSGTISLDSHSLHSLNLKWLRHNIGLVSQEPLLFATTIRDNIRNGNLNATEDQIMSAATDSYARDFIMRLPQGFDTLVGEKGVQLSGGQKQRIAIARALLRNPRILLLDEATSALDTAGEKIVQAALDKARVGRTTIVIAHRLSTIQNADRIFVLKTGVVVEQGTHSELMELQGLYYSLVRNQHQM